MSIMFYGLAFGSLVYDLSEGRPYAWAAIIPLSIGLALHFTRFR